MPLPFILGAAAVAAGTGGIGALIHGGTKMKKANDTLKNAQARHENNVARFEMCNKIATEGMDALGKLELEVLKSFDSFSNIVEKIQGRPKFKPYSSNDVTLPQYTGEELHRVSIGAGVLLGGLGGAAAGTAGGFAAAGATTAAVMALGTASTGTAIASLSGVAATNATLAALGGGAIAAGGGGIALGTTILGVATAGVGLMIGGIIFSLAGSGLSKKADLAVTEINKAEKEINDLCVYLNSLNEAERTFRNTLTIVYEVYKKHLQYLDTIVNFQKKTEWVEFSESEKLLTENTVLLVALLYNMCKVKLVLTSGDKNALNTVNRTEVNKTASYAGKFLEERNLMPMVEETFGNKH